MKITAADKHAGTASGTFIVKNQSGGDYTWVTLGAVWMDFVAKGKGDEGYYDATCTIIPEASGYVLAPHEEAHFEFACSDFVHMSGKLDDLSKAEELTAWVYVFGATNQVGEYRARLWHASSPTFKFN